MILRIFYIDRAGTDTISLCIQGFLPHQVIAFVIGIEFLSIAIRTIDQISVLVIVHLLLELSETVPALHALIPLGRIDRLALFIKKFRTYQQVFRGIGIPHHGISHGRHNRFPVFSEIPDMRGSSCFKIDHGTTAVPVLVGQRIPVFIQIKLRRMLCKFPLDFP